MIDQDDVKLIEASLNEYKIRQNILKKVGLIEELHFEKENWSMVYEVLDYVKQIITGEFKNENLRELYLKTLLEEQKDWVKILQEEAGEN